MEGVKEKETGIREFTENIKKEIKRPDVEKAKNVTYEALIEENKEKLRKPTVLVKPKNQVKDCLKKKRIKLRKKQAGRMI